MINLKVGPTSIQGARIIEKHVNLKVSIGEVRKWGSFCKHERGRSHFNIGKNIEVGPVFRVWDDRLFAFIFFNI